MEYELYEFEAKDSMKQAIKKYEENISKISTGRANPSLLNSVKVLYYETLTPINQIATISVPDPRQLLIKPFDLTITKDVVAAINIASLGVNAVNEGHQARITLPELTTQRRRELVKSLSHYTEQARISIRAARQDANKLIKSDDELSEDDVKAYLNEIQKLTDTYIAKVANITKTKEEDLMKI